MAKGPSAWITHLKSWTATKSKSNPSYTYRDAMKDPAARAEYKKNHGTASSSSSSSSSSKSHKKGKKMRGGSGYGGEASLANAASVNDSGSLLGGDDMASAPAVKGADVAPPATAPPATPAAPAQSGGKKSRRRKGTKGKKSRKTKSKKRKSRSSRK
jgi:hypothetical protein